MKPRVQRVAGTFLLMMLVGLSPARADKLDFAARLDGVCSGSGVAEKGWMTVSLNTATSSISYTLTYDPSVSATFQHIHGPVATGCGAGGTGGILVNLGGGTPFSGTATLSAANVDHLINGRLYTNVHNGPFPDGVITGDLYPVPKPRFVTIAPSKFTEGSAAATHAIRVRLASLHHPSPAPVGTPDFSAFEGEVRWVGPIQTVVEASQTTTHKLAPLQCTPHFQDLGTVPNLLHIFGAEVAPSSFYEIEVAEDTCDDLNDPGCYTPIHVVRTSYWGDLLAPFSEVAGSQPNFADINGIVGVFTGSASAPVMVRANLKGNVPDLVVNFADISRCVQAFQGAPYPFAGPTACP